MTLVAFWVIVRPVMLLDMGDKPMKPARLKLVEALFCDQLPTRGVIRRRVANRIWLIGSVNT